MTVPTRLVIDIDAEFREFTPPIVSREQFEQNFEERLAAEFDGVPRDAIAVAVERVDE